MSTSLLAGISGLATHQEMINVISNNIANANTAGFKTRRALFTDMMYRSLSDPAGPTVSSGSSDPTQIGMGAQIGRVSTAHTQGNLSPSAQPLDLALDGDGFFVLDGAGQEIYTRVGSFGLDEAGFIVDPSTGHYVKRFGQVGEPGDNSPGFQVPSDPRIQVPLGRTIPGVMTQNIELSGNLNSDTALPTQQKLVTSFPLANGGVLASETTLLNDLDANDIPYVAGDSIEINGSDADGTAINSTLAVDSTTTVGDLIAAIDALYNEAEVMLQDGEIVLEADEAGVSDLSLTLTDGVGNVGAIDHAQHEMVEARPGALGATVSNSVDVYDETGKAHTIILLLQRMDSSTWDLTATAQTDGASTVDGQVNGIRFNDDGSFFSSGLEAPEISFQFSENSPIQTYTLDFGSSGDFDGLTQTSVGNSFKVNQDGTAAGVLSTLNVAPDGMVKGVSSNGDIWDIAQLAIARFQNIQGLAAIGGTDFVATLSSGEPSIGGGGSDGRGSVQASQIENSNVDLAQEFTRLIVAQRGFSANARTVTVTEEILEEVTNLIR